MSTPDVFASEVFGAPVIRVEPDEMDAIDEAKWREGGIWLAWCRAHADVIPDVFDEDGHAWQHIETLETYRGWLPYANESTADVDMYAHNDMTGCAVVGALAFTEDRWHQDARIPKGKADLFKALWAMRSVDCQPSWPCARVAKAADGRVMGFLTFRKRYADIVVDLLAVHPEFRGEALARQLMLHAMQKSRASDCMGVRASTQSHNTAAKAFYESLGFVKVSEQHTYHWINEEAAP